MSQAARRPKSCQSCRLWWRLWWRRHSSEDLASSSLLRMPRLPLCPRRRCRLAAPKQPTPSPSEPDWAASPSGEPEVPREAPAGVPQFSGDARRARSASRPSRRERREGRITTPDEIRLPVNGMIRLVDGSAHLVSDEHSEAALAELLLIRAKWCREARAAAGLPEEGDPRRPLVFPGYLLPGSFLSYCHHDLQERLLTHLKVGWEAKHGVAADRPKVRGQPFFDLRGACPTALRVRVLCWAGGSVTSRVRVLHWAGVGRALVGHF